MMAFKQFVIVMLVLASLCSAHIGGQLLTQDIGPRVYCGRVLSRMIATLCFEDPNIEKRAESGSMFGLIMPPYYKEQETHIGWPWMSPSKAHIMESNRGKRFAGVANECCDKPCTIKELLSYC